RRNPVIAALTAAAVLLLLGLSVASLLAAGYFNRLASQEAEAAKNEAGLRKKTQDALEEATEQRRQAKDNLAKFRTALTQLADNRYDAGIAQLKGGKLDQAAQNFMNVLGLLEQLVQTDQKDVVHQKTLAATNAALATVELRLSDIHWKKGKLPEGHASWKKAREYLHAASESPPDDRELVGLLTAALSSVAENYVRAGLWKEAAEQYGACGKLKWQGTVPSAQAACASFLADDAAVYRDCCNRMLERLPGDLHTLWACGLDSRGQFDPARLIAIAGKARNDDAWQQHTVGLAYYRDRGFEKAIANCTGSTRSNWSALGVNYPLLAMAHHRLGKSEEATEYLKQCKEWFRRTPVAWQADSPTVIPANHNPHDWMVFEALYREASLLITKSPPFEEIFDQVHRGWLYTKLGEPGKSEKELKEAAAMPLKDWSLLVTRARLFLQIGERARAEADFAKAVALNPKDARPWIERARYFAERGRDKEADADFTRAAAVTDNLNRFIEAGWWVVGPYPEEMALPCPPEKDPNPSRPVAAVGNSPALVWHSTSTGDFGFVDLRSVFKGDHLSSYAMAYVYSPKECSATLLVGGDDAVRVRINGRLVHEMSALNQMQRVPVTFSAGRNTLLVKVNNITGPHYLNLRIADNSFDLVKTYSELGMWKQAGRHYGNLKLPDEPEAWFRRAYAMLQSGDNKGYQELCRQLLDKYLPEKNGHLLNWAARVCVLDAKAVNDWTQPVFAAQKASELHRSHSGILITLAAALYRAGQWDDAIQQCLDSRQAKDRGDGDNRVLTDLLLAMAYHRKGEVEAAKGWWRDAEDWFQKETAKLSGLQAVRGPDKMRWEDWLLVQVLRKEAAALLKEEVKEHPEVARLHEKIKKFEPATYDFDLALLLQPKEPRLWLARACRNTELKRDKEAETDFDKAVEFKPNDRQVWVDRARVYAALGQIDNAARDFSTALEVRPKDPGWVLRLFREDLIPREKVLAKLSREFRPRDGELQALIEEREALQKWTKALAGRKLIQQRTEMAGGTAGSPFDHVPKDLSLLKGFTVWTGLWNNRMVIRGLQPIFFSATGAGDGPGCGHCSGPSTRIVAKEGYAVAGIVAKKTEGEILLHGLKIVFMRIDGAGLNPKDSYESDWVGGQGGQDIRLGGDGQPIIGIFGRAGQAIDALGLVQLEVDPSKKEKKP
ncbi:MAG TPA: hypothetical protein VKE98_00605, partial [Gemmataceae bacterium]|nr:hypothetical protein [Gemmataceae bacterium]